MFASPLSISLSDWRHLSVRNGNDEDGWRQRTGQLVQTLVSSSPPAYPIRLPGVRPDMSSALRTQPPTWKDLCTQSLAMAHAHKERPSPFVPHHNTRVPFTSERSSFQIG